jgi:uncharacterized phage protein gp47/JayE
MLGHVQKEFLHALPNQNKMLTEFSPVMILAKTFTGAVHMLHKHVEILQSQQFPDTATGVHLDRLAGFCGVLRRPSTQTKIWAKWKEDARMDKIMGKKVVPWHEHVGMPIRSSDDSLALVLFDQPAASTDLLEIRTELRGALHLNTHYPLTKGETLQLTKLIPGVCKDLVIDHVLEGIDEESDDSLRSRLLLTIKGPGPVGCVRDVVRWVLETPLVDVQLDSVEVFPATYKNRREPGSFAIKFLVKGKNKPSETQVEEVRKWLIPKLPLGVVRVEFL